jgi:uncharacterized protein (TIGR00725 family)
MDLIITEREIKIRDDPGMTQRKIQIAVIGGSDAEESELNSAERVGSLLAEKQVILLSGGMGGIMEASCRGALKADGLTVGIVPETLGNQYLSVIIRTRMNHARNFILIGSADAVIAIGGEYGTLSEIAYALKSGIPVYGLNTWEIRGVIRCSSPDDAVARALEKAAITILD